jgi:hypothetical protein
VTKTYILEAGIQSRRLPGFESTGLILPNDEDIIEFDITVYADGMEIEPNWTQSFTFRRYEESPLLEFTLKPIEEGLKKIRLDFFYQQHWLAKIEFAVRVVTQALAIPASA